MSGPKISVYSLTGWARKVVDGQIQCEQRGLVCGEQIKSLLSACSGMGTELVTLFVNGHFHEHQCALM